MDLEGRIIALEEKVATLEVRIQELQEPKSLNIEEIEKQLAEGISRSLGIHRGIS